MNDNNRPEQFSTPEERKIAVTALESEIARLMVEIENAYSHLGRSLCAMTEQETTSINEMADQVVALKQKLRKLKEKDDIMPS